MSDTPEAAYDLKDYAELLAALDREGFAFTGGSSRRRW